MKCNFDKEKLSAYIDGELAQAESREVEAHLSKCQECQNTYKNLLFAITEVRNLPYQQAPDKIHSNVMAEITALKQKSVESYRRPFIFAMAAAALILLAVSIIYLIEQSPQARVSQRDIAAKPQAKPVAYDEGRFVKDMAGERPQAVPPSREEEEKEGESVKTLAEKEAMPSELEDREKEIPETTITIYADDLNKAQTLLNSYVALNNIPMELRKEGPYDARPYAARTPLDAPDIEAGYMILSCTESQYNEIVSMAENNKWQVVPDIEQYFEKEIFAGKVSKKSLGIRKVDKSKAGTLKKVNIILKQQIQQQQIPLHQR